ncbi:MAG: hypothetical protein MRJ65_11905 [Candidatus Brocadiaceae bacterium]|nr:hypothetical protein [Candidatus Brocadiaceae bacterium]
MRLGTRKKIFKNREGFSKYGSASFIKNLQRGDFIYQRIDAARGPRVKTHGRWVVSFLSSCYLGLNQNRYVEGAVFDALERWGLPLAYYFPRETWQWT